MYLVLIAWVYVTLMMAVAEATSSQGSVLGAIITFVLYGVAPVSLVMYLLRTPARRKALRAREAAASIEPDAGSHAAAAAKGDAVAPVRKEP
jgi:ABC-type transport system involved in cytochrome c biogenesis permease subunit